MPRPRIHKDNAAKQRAYRQRKRKSAAPATPSAPSTVERSQKAGDQALETFFGNRVR